MSYPQTHWLRKLTNGSMASKTYPDARLTAQGDVVAFDDDTPLPNYSGLVYATLQGHPYILWLYPAMADGSRRWDVVNAGPVIVQSELDKFMKENTIG